jgi:inner membrane protein
MRALRRASRLLPGREEALSPLGTLICLAILLAADWTYVHIGGNSFFPEGALDEIAHFLTALLLLQLLPAAQRARLAGPALLASVAIDVDHVPQYLGYYFLTAGTPRPYLHSLLTVVVLLGFALGLRRHRRLFIGLALGVLLHFFRDLGEGGGSAVSLLWPLSDHGYSYPHAAYIALICAAAAAGVVRGLLRRRTAAGGPRTVRRRSASRASV